VDGGSRGNPGLAGAGVVICEDGGQLLFEAGYFLGRQTNNSAEYHALIRALERAGQCPPQPVIVHSDSELLVRQITGRYRVKSALLAPLVHQVQMNLLRIGHWSIRHVRRDQNVRADQLANLAMDRQCDVILFDVAAGGRVAAQPAPPRAVQPVPQTADEGPTLLTGKPAVRVTVSRAPATAACPADLGELGAFTVQATLPVGLCVHAAHALLPTLLGILNTDADEFAAVPTLTVRCGRPGCHAEFRLSPVRSPNGKPRA
jgi:ribonuclease HI